MKDFESNSNTQKYPSNSYRSDIRMIREFRNFHSTAIGKKRPVLTREGKKQLSFNHSSSSFITDLRNWCIIRNVIRKWEGQPYFPICISTESISSEVQFRENQSSSFIFWGTVTIITHHTCPIGTLKSRESSAWTFSVPHTRHVAESKKKQWFQNTLLNRVPSKGVNIFLVPIVRWAMPISKVWAILERKIQK